MEESLCIVDKTGIISWCTNEFYLFTGLKYNDNIHEHIDNSISNTGDIFIDKIKNIHLQNNRFDLFPINQQMITPDGWKYRLDVNNLMTNDYVSMIIKDIESIYQRLFTIPLYRLATIPSYRRAILHFNSPIKVVAVDDSRVTCNIIKRLIDQTLKHSCDIEVESINFLDINLQDYDLFIIDIHMPGYGGLELIEMIKGDRRLKSNAKFAAISSDDRSDLIHQCINKGYDIFVPKPFNNNKLKSLIHTYKTITRPE